MDDQHGRECAEFPPRRSFFTGHDTSSGVQASYLRTKCEIFTLLVGSLGAVGLMEKYTLDPIDAATIVAEWPAYLQSFV